MNVVFLLVPKCDVTYLPLRSSLRQAFETLRAHNHNEIPVVDEEGHYCGTVSTSDLLNFVYDHNLPAIHELEDYPISLIMDQDSNPPLTVNAEFSELLNRLQDQNFVAVIDDRDLFTGIITRKVVMTFLKKRWEYPNLRASSLHQDATKRYSPLD